MKLLSPWSQSTFHWASFPQSLLQGMFPSTLHPQSTINLLSTFPTRFSAQFFENPPLDSDSFLTHWHHRAAPCQETESGEWRKLCRLPWGIHWNGQGGDHKKLLQANSPHCLSRTVLQHKATCRHERECRDNRAGRQSELFCFPWNVNEHHSLGHRGAAGNNARNTEERVAVEQRAGKPGPGPLDADV